jgi:pimeloyl-ACP methyl ester carboxylesterase
MLTKLDAFQSELSTRLARFLQETSDSLNDHMVSWPARLSLSSFPPRVDPTAQNWVQRLPEGPRHVLRSSWDRAYDRLSPAKRARTGEKIYNRYNQFRRRLLGANEKFVALEPGVISYWETKPHPQKETIVFLHGFADSKDTVHDFAQEMVPDYHLVAPDLPGFGKSFKSQDYEYNLENLTKWLRHWAKAIGLKRFHLMGNSLGGAAAIHFALTAPTMVESLTLVSPAAVIHPDHPSVYDELLAGQNIFQLKTLQEFDAFMKRVFHRQPYLPPFVKDYLFQIFDDHYEWYGQLVDQTFGGVKNVEDPNFRSLFLNDHLAKLDMPTHIIWGEHDRLFPVEFGKLAHEAISHSKFSVLDAIGHVPQVENPKVFAETVRAFLNEARAKAPST